MIERSSATWMETEKWAKAEITRLHLELEADQAEKDTNRTRGEIAALRRVLALATIVLPETVPPTDDYGQ